MPLLNAVYVMDPRDWPKIYGPEEQKAIAEKVNILGPVYSAQEALRHPEILGRADILLSGWLGPKLDEHFLSLMPKLKVVLYGAGGIGYIMTPAFVRKNIPISTANAINAIPVAEYSLAHIILALKSYRRNVQEAKSRRTFIYPQVKCAGGFRSTVGLVSLSTIGRLVRQKLASMEVAVMAYDPCVDPLEAARLEVTLAGLPELFAESDVVSVHAPLIKETVGMVTGELIASMKHGATFINTSRGGVVREKEMIEVLKQRPDLTAILDVTDPEPPHQDCGLFDLPNVWVSPHIAGSLDRECSRMGRWVLHELERFLAGEPLRGLVDPRPLVAA
jgi:phosphoglycerate dehydrogenase-like enzyme